MIARVLALAALVALTACTDGNSPLAPRPTGDAAPPDAKAPDAAPAPVNAAGAKRRPKIPMPDIPAPPPRPEGEPQNPEDLGRLSEAAGAGAPIDKPGAPPIKRLDAYRLRVGRVFVDRLNRFIEIPAKVNMTEGILEYYGVSSNGKLHESVLELDAEPSHMHLGLLLIGLDPREYSKEDDPYKVPTIAREGGRIEMRVRYVDPETREERDIPAEDWLWDRKAEKHPPPQVWYFQGSAFWSGRYSADSDRSVVALIPDSSAVVVIGGDAGNPYRGDALGFEVNKQLIPPKDTPVKLALKVYGAEPGKIPEPKPAVAAPKDPEPPTPEAPPEAP